LTTASRTVPYTQAATSGKAASAKLAGFPGAVGQFVALNPTTSRGKELPPEKKHSNK